MHTERFINTHGNLIPVLYCSCKSYERACRGDERGTRTFQVTAEDKIKASVRGLR